MVYPIIYRVSNIQGGAGFLPCTVGTSLERFLCAIVDQSMINPLLIINNHYSVGTSLNKHMFFLGYVTNCDYVKESERICERPWAQLLTPINLESFMDLNPDSQQWKGHQTRPSGWWFATFVFPYSESNSPNRLIFFRGVETTNQPLIRFGNYRLSRYLTRNRWSQMYPDVSCALVIESHNTHRSFSSWYGSRMAIWCIDRLDLPRSFDALMFRHFDGQTRVYNMYICTV